ncbi:NFACT family protein [Candidatus Woesearchaeota archaeon]|nr:NFACT family protein [Candidatus Woesearchaeota archaeon]
MPFILSALDVHYLVKELRPLVQDAFVDKVYQGEEEKGDSLLRMRSPRTGKQQLYVKVPEALFLTEHRFPWPRQPTGFCMQLRKHLTNAQLVSVEQHAFDRIVELVFKKGEKRWTLVIELFSKGNVVFINNEGVIRGVMDLQRWKDRTLRVNAPYEYPPQQNDTKTMSLEQLRERWEENDKELVKFCATALGLGGKYAEELLSRTTFDKNTKELGKKGSEQLHAALQALFEEAPRPTTHGEDAAPFPLHTWKEVEQHPTFSAAIEALVIAEKRDVVDSAAAASTRTRQDKYDRIIEAQTKKLDGYKRSAEENQRKGERIYECYQELSSLLEKIGELHDRDGWAAVKEHVKEHKLLVTVDGKSGKLTVDL